MPGLYVENNFKRYWKLSLEEQFIFRVTRLFLTELERFAFSVGSFMMETIGSDQNWLLDWFHQLFIFIISEKNWERSKEDKVLYWSFCFKKRNRVWPEFSFRYLHIVIIFIGVGLAARHTSKARSKSFQSIQKDVTADQCDKVNTRSKVLLLF